MTGTTFLLDNGTQPFEPDQGLLGFVSAVIDFSENPIDAYDLYKILKIKKNTLIHKVGLIVDKKSANSGNTFSLGDLSRTNNFVSAQSLHVDKDTVYTTIESRSGSPGVFYSEDSGIRYDARHDTTQAKVRVFAIISTPRSS